MSRAKGFSGSGGAFDWLMASTSSNWQAPSPSSTPSIDSRQALSKYRTGRPENFMIFPWRCSALSSFETLLRKISSAFAICCASNPMRPLTWSPGQAADSCWMYA